MVALSPALGLAEVPGEGERWEDESDAGAGAGADQRVQRPVVGRQQRKEPDEQRCRHHMSFGGWPDRSGMYCNLASAPCQVWPVHDVLPQHSSTTVACPWSVARYQKPVVLLWCTLPSWQRCVG